MNNYQAMKKPKLARFAWKRHAQRRMRLLRRPKFFRRMVERKRYWQARRKMHGHQNMTLRQGFLAGLLHDLRRMA